jgi:hypothetical protein
MRKSRGAERGRVVSLQNVTFFSKSEDVEATLSSCSEFGFSTFIIAEERHAEEKERERE